MNDDAMRMLLLIAIVSLALLAIFYLRLRQLPWPAYCFWGLVALFLPVLGPFLVIAIHPGRPKSARQLSRADWLRQRRISS